ncbi:MAG: flagellar protein FlgN [Fusobacteriaceae bacterium]|nr:flagellar protein FlgN [Fusobacteriaceae bacterium]MBP6467160.1 flagellar protein FlgN [Fusobacteriaceae bacterium]MBP9596777.1 flagellar protein FlgN [Fusobacteriaceae bacterium]MBU9917580.1 flagellar protein FlgN [Fusobacteriaceae bacterium]
MSKNSLERLKDILEEEYKMYQKEFSFVEERLELIRERKFDKLQELIKKEKFLEEYLKNLEKERINITNEYKVNTLNELILTLERKEKEEFSNLRKNLIKVLEDIKHKNELCEKLVDLSAQMLDTILNEASGKKDVGYNQFKQKSSMTNNNLLNTRG